MTNGHRSAGCTHTYRCTSINLSPPRSNLNYLLCTFNGSKLYFVLIHYVTSGSQKVFQPFEGFSSEERVVQISADVCNGGKRKRFMMRLRNE